MERMSTIQKNIACNRLYDIGFTSVKPSDFDDYIFNNDMTATEIIEYAVNNFGKTTIG